MAAGAAHELATPLSTIDVIVRELSRHLEDCEKPESVDTDLSLIDGQLEMCRQILQRMRSAAGDSMAHRWDKTTVGDLIDTRSKGFAIHTASTWSMAANRLRTSRSGYLKKRSPRRFEI